MATSSPSSAPPGERARGLRIALVVGAIVAAVELGAGAGGNSLVLLSDGAHYVVDLVAVALALAAVGWGARPADPAHSFGHQRVEVLASLANAVLLWAMAAVFLWEALVRFASPVPVDGTLLVVVGAFTFVANLSVALVLRRRATEDLNQRAVYLHTLSDGAGSLGAVVAGGLIVGWGWTEADPAATLFVVALMVVFAYRISRDALEVLMEGTPAGIVPADVAASLGALSGVEGVHDLHVWTLAPGTISVSAHLVVGRAPSDDRLIHAAERLLAERYHIRHTT
ncbi:MAG: cation diffusion facilitator family transporter, partial [Thermoplasmata archaeon]